MKPVRLIATAAAALTLATLAGTAPAQADMPTAIGLLQAGAQQGVKDGYPGVIGLLRDGDTVRYAQAGTGDTATGVPADPKAQFRIGSNTKAFTATVLLQLEAEGRLSLDDTVAKWLPGAVAANGYDGSKITLRELLNHTSGLPDYDNAVQFALSYSTDPNRAWPPQSLVDLALAQHAPSAAPGQQWSYANTNFVLAGMVIKAVTGNDPATEIQHRIIDRLGLTGTSFPTSDPTLHGNYLHGYEYQWLGLTRADVTVSNVQAFGPAGAMVSTLDDLAAFTRALLNGTLLPPAQEAELKTTVPTTNTGMRYGLGIAQEQTSCGKTVWTHNGAVLGYFSFWAATDDGRQQLVEANDEYHFDAGTKGIQDTGTAAFNAFCSL
ncbi:serine hydrolase domain-containing protein [Kitasatospora viridis]|uniref:D-alanyl-D-alanine carboxypeptidase n=1 Tax=Kitasatospora viridis TaxID=281105 RepID=A0A561S9E4_9ACTN|nr:serine hydrolase domain-containing protein [Kitasatospora viridis]TWF71492.1 D-alanyl-D-alanine carboxypeptidase [Kitasatospora viridis]